MTPPVFKVLESEGCRSYLVGCPTTRRALLVDPKVGMERAYGWFLDAYGLELGAVLDTHTHADHISASSVFAGAGVELYMSHRTPVRRTKTALEGGAQLAVGDLSFEVREVPGHTVDSLALVGHGLAFTGDSLFLGGLARADFRGSDPAQLFESVQRELMSLPDDTLVFPGHDYADVLFSTIGTERATNGALAHADGAAYAASLGVTVEGTGNSAAVDRNLALNLAADPELPDAPPAATTCCASPTAGDDEQEVPELAPGGHAAAHATLTRPSEWIDVRDPVEWNAGRIPGTVSIPLSELGFHLERLRAEPPRYLSCRSGVRSVTAAKTLRHVGVVADAVNVGGGILAWQGQGLAIEGLPAR
jgi:glyoxylase-like metal-dependent hydrolase (beta-lactamase superfamily II)/rhodanese-related sulfurtransferase